MALLRLIAEGIGPLRELDLDLSDGAGRPHLGPHILAGVNGSGKSTVLRSVAWACDLGRRGFSHSAWSHFLSGWPASRAMVVIKHRALKPTIYLVSQDPRNEGEATEAITDWVRSFFPGMDGPTLVRELLPDRIGLVSSREREAIHVDPPFRWWRIGKALFVSDRQQLNLAAYSPSRALSHIERPDLNKRLKSPFSGSMGFERTVRNEEIQAWLLTLHSKRAIATEKGQPADIYTRSIEEFERALREIWGNDVKLDVSIEPTFTPRIRIRSKDLNFSQLPDGVRNTVGWLADFMMRRDVTEWDPSLEGERPGILLLDEVDTHLHPRWQRTLLPAMRAALPGVQLIVSTHSPFVISSCAGARVHVLDTGSDGLAHLRESVDAPLGSSLMATMKDIFDVESRFDVQTERELNEWNQLKAKERAGNLPRAKAIRLEELTQSLSARSEELRLIVSTPPALSRRLVETLSQR